MALRRFGAVVGRHAETKKDTQGKKERHKEIETDKGQTWKIQQDITETNRGRHREKYIDMDNTTCPLGHLSAVCACLNLGVLLLEEREFFSFSEKKRKEKKPEWGGIGGYWGVSRDGSKGLLLLDRWSEVRRDKGGGSRGSARNKGESKDQKWKKKEEPVTELFVPVCSAPSHRCCFHQKSSPMIGNVSSVFENKFSNW
jgi:hypothetical protein